MDPKIKPTIIPYSQHGIDPKKIHAHAIDVIKRLKQAGFDAYLVGGGIRDLLLNRHPKDFDVATNALPNQIKKLFHRCLLIGRRFRLAHVYFGRDIVEVATFRASHHETAHVKNGIIIRDNVYGAIEQDVIRRDFTVNALYYDIETQNILDFCDGFHDIQHRFIHMIGAPDTRYREDPVRMLRAIRFAGKMDFKLTEETSKPLLQLNSLLQYVSPSRLYDETIKLFHSGHAETIYHLLKKFELFKELFPLTDESLKTNHQTEKLILQLFKNTDKRIHEQRPVMPYFLFAVLLWIPLKTQTQKLLSQYKTHLLASDKAIKEIMQIQRQHIMIPRRALSAIYDIWILQHRLETRRPRYIIRLLTHPKFRAAYDLLLLRESIQEIPQEVTHWWTQIQNVDKNLQKQMIKDLSENKLFKI